jgi:hypothetical protein
MPLVARTRASCRWSRRRAHAAGRALLHSSRDAQTALVPGAAVRSLCHMVLARGFAPQQHKSERTITGVALLDLTIDGQTYGVVVPDSWDAARVLEDCRASMRGEPRHDTLQVLDLADGGRMVVSWRQVATLSVWKRS